MTNNRKQQIETLLQSFAPTVLEVLDESHMHNVPSGAQSHFRVTIVSTQFEGVGLVDRQRRVNQALSQVFAAGLHALALHTYTPSQWQAKGAQTPASPDCKGGSKTDQSSGQA